MAARHVFEECAEDGHVVPGMCGYVHWNSDGETGEQCALSPEEHPTSVEVAHPNSRRDKATVKVSANLDVDVGLALEELAKRLKTGKSILVNEAVKSYVEKMKDIEFGHPL